MLDFTKEHAAAGFCPKCGYTFDASAGNDQAPGEGDFSICINCTSILRFGKGLILELASNKDFADAPLDFVEAIAQVRRAILMAHKTIGKPEDRQKSSMN